MMIHCDVSDFTEGELKVMLKTLEIAYFQMPCEGWCKSCPNRKPCELLACIITSIKGVIKSKRAR